MGYCLMEFNSNLGFFKCAKMRQKDENESKIGKMSTFLGFWEIKGAENKGLIACIF